jgi:hypothetical protein
MENGEEEPTLPLALVTGGALFGIKSIGSYAEHVVALDANAVQDGADDGVGLTDGFHARRMLVDGAACGKFGGHVEILARGVGGLKGTDGIP